LPLRADDERQALANERIARQIGAASFGLAGLGQLPASGGERAQALVGAKGGRQIGSGVGLGEILGDQRPVDPVGLGAQTTSLAKGEDRIGVDLHVTDARLGESPTQSPCVTAGRLHGEKRRAGSRDPGRQRLRRIGDALELFPTANIDPSFRNIDADKTFAAIALHCAPRQIEPDLGRRAGLHTGVKAQTTVRASDRDAGGSEMATVFQDQSTIGEPAGVPSLPGQASPQCNPRGLASKTRSRPPSQEKS
jgi:hypothetical protein